MNMLLRPTSEPFIVRTPDDIDIRFELLNKTEVLKILTPNNFKPLLKSELDFFQKNAYLLKNDEILYEFNPNKSFFLFGNLKEYRKIVRGVKYYQSGFMIEESKVYASFNLNSDAAKKFFDERVKKLNNYPVFDGYQAYLLSNGAVGFLRHRIGNIYDGYWHPSLQDFEKFYYFLTSDNYTPSKKV